MQRINLQQIQSFEQFYRIPKIFFTSEKYKDMRLESKTAYAILRDRFELSLKNGWIDEQQNVYFIFTVAALQEILGCGKNKVIAIKKDLAKYGLLEEEKIGFNRANRLYLGAVTSDSFSENSLKALGDKEVSKSNLRKFENQTTGGLKNKPPKVSKSNPNDTDYSDTELSDTEIKDDEDDDVFNNTRANDLDLLVDHYQKETGQRPNLKQANRLEQLANLYGALLVSEAITRSAENNTSNLLYIEKVAQSMNEVQQKQFSQVRQFNEPIVPITKLSDMEGGLI
ncbi:replication initiator protein A [Fructobacillus americanaquae]|uniref:Replication initiator protein A n=1 Tax=Fructobacillus americanaquae TaxID=2940302 RepID=A0ABY5C499_9LACO|nr:replication initiator protein A [Fructobacillus americanaquae]USS92155.1 replication initiator protein A [Fructobacillus americanaquae]